MSIIMCYAYGHQAGSELSKNEQPEMPFIKHQSMSIITQTERFTEPLGAFPALLDEFQLI